MTHRDFMNEAILLAEKNLDNNQGGPFGCVIVKNGKIIGRGNNQVTGTNDPTAHAEIIAIRDACKNLNTFQLQGCTLYTTCEPCPMCLGAIYWARPDRIYYGNSSQDAAAIEFDDEYIYNEIKKPILKRDIIHEQLMHQDCKKTFDKWLIKTDKIHY